MCLEMRSPTPPVRQLYITRMFTPSSCVFQVFGKSMFEDEVTNASMRQLYLAGDQEDEDMFDVDAIVSSVTGVKSTTSKT